MPNYSDIIRDDQWANIISKLPILKKYNFSDRAIYDDQHEIIKEIIEEIISFINKHNLTLIQFFALAIANDAEMTEFLVKLILKFNDGLDDCNPFKNKMLNDITQIIIGQAQRNPENDLSNYINLVRLTKEHILPDNDEDNNIIALILKILNASPDKVAERIYNYMIKKPNTAGAIDKSRIPTVIYASIAELALGTIYDKTISNINNIYKNPSNTHINKGILTIIYTYIRQFTKDNIMPGLYEKISASTHITEPGYLKHIYNIISNQISNECYDVKKENITKEDFVKHILAILNGISVIPYLEEHIINHIIDHELGGENTEIYSQIGVNIDVIIQEYNNQKTKTPPRAPSLAEALPFEVRKQLNDTFYDMKDQGLSVPNYFGNYTRVVVPATTAPVTATDAPTTAPATATDAPAATNERRYKKIIVFTLLAVAAILAIPLNYRGTSGIGVQGTSGGTPTSKAEKVATERENPNSNEHGADL